MRHLILMLTCALLSFSKLTAVEDTTITMSDSIQVKFTDSVEVNPGVMMDSIYRNLDPQYMATNLLVDRSLPFVDYSNYHGHLADSNLMTYSKLLRLNAAMLTSIHDTGYGVKFTDTLRHWINHHDSLGYQPFTLLNLHYDQLKDSALADSLIQKTGIQLEDVPGRSENPYHTRRLFARVF